MKRILHIISSPRGEASFSIKLGNAIVDKIRQAYPDSTVRESNLVTKKFPHLEEAHITSFFTPPEKRTAENLVAIKHSDDAIRELQDADFIVIGVPLYNFSIHSTLKAWIDHIVRSGVTFKSDEHGISGLIGGKKVYLALASGFIYSDGPMKPLDFADPYLRTVLGFYGDERYHHHSCRGNIRCRIQRICPGKSYRKYQHRTPGRNGNSCLMLHNLQ